MGIFYGHLEYFTYGHVVYIQIYGDFGNLVYYYQFWSLASRKIWQP
jgi:hypothetical protein